jgi:S1-C subfamily serine protease
VYTVLLLAALPGQYVDDSVFSKALQKTAFEATVRIYHPRSRSVGTAVMIGRKDGFTYFLTAAHLVPTKPYPGREGEEARSVELLFYRMSNPDHVSSEGIAWVDARMVNEDLAVLKAKLPNDPPVLQLCPPTELKIKTPMTVMTLGAILDGPPEIKIDKVNGRKKIKKPDETEALYWEASVPQQAGRSGGPMIDSRGYVIGIASGTQHQKGYYICIDEILNALKGPEYEWLYKVVPLTK